MNLQLKDILNETLTSLALTKQTKLKADYKFEDGVFMRKSRQKRLIEKSYDIKFKCKINVSVYMHFL